MNTILPFKSTILNLVKSYKNDVCDEEVIELTIGVNGENREYGAQSGDNSFSGAAYHYPHWAVVTIDRHSNCRDIVDDILSQWNDLIIQ
jgi:hypothetical protein